MAMYLLELRGCAIEHVYQRVAGRRVFRGFRLR